MFKIIGNRKIWYSISIVLSILSISALFIFGLRVGVDYKGGTILELESRSVNFSATVEDTLKEFDIKSYQIKESGQGKYSIRLEELDNTRKNSIIEKIQAKASDVKEISFDSVGPTVGNDLKNKSVSAVIVASIAIIIFIAYSFRKVPKPLSSWKFGLFAVLALIHDLLVTTGIVAVLSHFLPWMEVDILFITALLTIMGFSVHDTIVIYDRLRENFIRFRHKSIEQVAEESVNQTLARSINTSITTIIVLFALLLLGGTPIRHFVIVLMFGIFIGTYSSIFLAASLVVSSHKNLSDTK